MANEIRVLGLGFKNSLANPVGFFGAVAIASLLLKCKNSVFDSRHLIPKAHTSKVSTGISLWPNTPKSLDLVHAAARRRLRLVFPR